MKVTFIKTTNSLAEPIIGQEVNLSYGMNAFFTFNADNMDFDYRKGEWRTSLITNIKIEEVSLLCYEITIDTSNSQYVFRKGELSEKKPLTKDEKMAIAMMTMI